MPETFNTSLPAEVVEANLATDAVANPSHHLRGHVGTKKIKLMIYIILLLWFYFKCLK